jgi:hypothetical protein
MFRICNYQGWVGVQLQLDIPSNRWCCISEEGIQIYSHSFRLLVWAEQHPRIISTRLLLKFWFPSVRYWCLCPSEKEQYFFCYFCSVHAAMMQCPGVGHCWDKSFIPFRYSVFCTENLLAAKIVWRVLYHWIHGRSCLRLMTSLL